MKRRTQLLERRRPKGAAAPARGFTLLEVMVAVAILGLGLTAILSAQAGAFANAAHARNLSIATGLARCRMTELEERLLREGYQELDEIESGPCCNDEDTPGMRCAWKIEKLELPEPKYGQLDLDAQLGDIASGPLGMLGALSPGATGTDGTPPAVPEGDAGVAGLLGGAAGGDGLAAASGLTRLAMSFVYPQLKGIFEASSRRVTVTVQWTEGTRERQLEIVQWVTNPQMGGLVGDIDEEALAPGGAGFLGGGSGTGTGGRTGPTTGPSSGPRGR